MNIKRVAIGALSSLTAAVSFAVIPATSAHAEPVDFCSWRGVIEVVMADDPCIVLGQWHWNGHDIAWYSGAAEALNLISENPKDPAVNSTRFYNWQSVPGAKATDNLWRSQYAITDGSTPGTLKIFWKRSTTKITVLEMRRTFTS